MRVIRKTVLDKIDEEIDENPDDIVRIELNNEEFKEFISLFREIYSNLIDNNLIIKNNYLVKTGNGPMDNYAVYRGIYIHTHEENK